MTAIVSIVSLIQRNVKHTHTSPHKSLSVTVYFTVNNTFSGVSHWDTICHTQFTVTFAHSKTSLLHTISHIVAPLPQSLNTMSCGSVTPSHTIFAHNLISRSIHTIRQPIELLKGYRIRRYTLNLCACGCFYFNRNWLITRRFERCQTFVNRSDLVHQLHQFTVTVTRNTQCGTNNTLFIIFSQN